MIGVIGWGKCRKLKIGVQHTRKKQHRLSPFHFIFNMYIYIVIFTHTHTYIYMYNLVLDHENLKIFCLYIHYIVEIGWRNKIC